MTFLIALVARWGVPARFQALAAKAIAIGAVAALIAAAWGIWLWQHDKKVIREHERAIAEQVQRKDAAADEAARKAAADAKADVDAGNARAREAARGSDDPWRDGLEQLP